MLDHLWKQASPGSMPGLRNEPRLLEFRFHVIDQFPHSATVHGPKCMLCHKICISWCLCNPWWPSYLGLVCATPRAEFNDTYAQKWRAQFVTEGHKFRWIQFKESPVPAWGPSLRAIRPFVLFRIPAFSGITPIPVSSRINPKEAETERSNVYYMTATKRRKWWLW